MNEWKEVTIGDLCETVSITYKGKDREVVLVNTSDVLEGKVLNHQPVLNENLKGQFKKTFQKNDILYSEIRPSNKRFAFIDFENTDCYIASTKLMVLRPKTELVIPHFLYAILTSKRMINEMQSLAETRSGTFPQITFSSELAPYRVNLPDFATQKKIVSLLEAIEHKIEVNKQINDNLQQQLSSIFHRIFDKENRDVALGEAISTTSGGTPSRKKLEFYENADVCWVKSKELLGGYLSDTEEHINDLAISKSAAKILPAKSVLIAMYGATVGAYAITSREMTCNQAICALLENDRYPHTYLFQYAKEYQGEIVNLAVGSAQQNISQVTIKQLSVHSDTDKIQRFDEIASPIHRKLQQLELENKYLANLRDSLLPKLMSGEIDVANLQL